MIRTCGENWPRRTRRAGNIMIGVNAAESKKSARHRSRAYRSMLQESPRDRKLRKGLAETYMNLSAFYGFSGQSEPNVEVVSRAIDLLEELWAEDKEVKIAGMLGGSYSGRALQKGWHGDYQAVLELTRGGEPNSSARCFSSAPKDEGLLEGLGLAYRRGSRTGFLPLRDRGRTAGR